MSIQKYMRFHIPQGGPSRGGGEEEGPRKASVPGLEFSADHDLCRLRAQWLGTERQNYPMRIDLWQEDAAPLLFSDEELPGEKERLQLLLSFVARGRAEQVFAGGSAAELELDEAAYVFLSGNEMAAWLFLFPPVGAGRILTGPELCRIAAESGVKQGLDWALLRRLPTSAQRWFRLFPIARGTPSIPGRDGQVIDRYARVLEGEIQVEQLAKANYETLRLVQDIEEGDVICEILPPEAGAGGKTVTGRELPPVYGQAAAVPQGRNTRLSEDGRHLVAEQRGHVVFSGRSFQVKPVLDLSEQELLYPQCIKFLGDVHVHGDLSGGSSICALGTVQVDGVVEDGMIEAGEHIIASSGVQGQDRAVLHAHRNIYAKYLEHCTVYAREGVYADCIINCRVHSNRDVRVRTGRGVVIGGSVQAAREVSAVTVGSKAERATGITLGGQPCEEAERMQIAGEIEALEREIAERERQPASGAGGTPLGKLRLNLCVAKMKLDKIDKDLQEWQTPHFGDDRPRLICDRVYPGTTVTIGRKVLHVSQEEEHYAMGLVGGRIGRLD